MSVLEAVLVVITIYLMVIGWMWFKVVITEKREKNIDKFINIENEMALVSDKIARAQELVHDLANKVFVHHDLSNKVLSHEKTIERMDKYLNTSNISAAFVPRSKRGEASVGG